MSVYHIESQRNPDLTLVQDGLYLICGITILSRTLSIIPVTICGRLPFPAFYISLIPFSHYCMLFFSKIDSVVSGQKFSFAPKNGHAFVKLHGWI